MSVNKILKKRKQQSGAQQGQQQYPDHQSTTGPQFIPQTPKMSQQQTKLEEQFQKYSEYTQSNPSTYQFSNTHLPYSATLYSRFRMPISIFAPPVSYDMDPVERNIDKIPRCTSCRAYMNYYNEIKKRGFRCFVCGTENLLGDYVVDAENIELCHSSYHVIGGENVYTRIPPEKAIAFLIDLNSTSYTSKALYYFVAAAKQVLSREQFNEIQIYFFTYDEVVHQYDFTGDQVKCTILDPSINISQGKTQETFLEKIRDKLFALLDNLEEMAQHNTKQGSNFFKAFSYVSETIKNTAAKIYILQSNEAISGQSFTNEYLKNPNQQNQTKPKSFLQTKNKALFTTFVDLYTKMSLSCSFFIFQKNYKNIRVLGDFTKVTNSQIFLYRKDSTQDIMKFYYDLSYVLGATYYQDVKMQFIITPTWYFTAVYGNIFRIREHITFKMCHLQSTKRVCVTFLPHENMQLPYCCMQVVTNYIYNRQHFVTVNTVVIPLTTSLDKLFANQNFIQSAATLHRTFLSGVRIQEINLFRNKIIKQLALTWKAASDYYKKKMIPEVQTLMLSQLALLKSSHFQLESINDSIILDNIVAQRNFLQSCGINELSNFFSPYLFNLTAMTEEMCRDDENFVYPEACELKFASVKQGMFLMDNGVSMILYISKICDPFFMKALFGKDKFSKNQQLTEQSFLTDGLFAEQVSNLIRVCREQKSYGWVPVYIVRCGENTLNEKLFYMNFYSQKYEEFRGFKMTLNEFLAYLGQNY